MLVFGFDIIIPTHLTKQKETYNYENLADMVWNNIAKATDVAKELILSQKFRNKHYYDKKAEKYEINVNDLVLVKNMQKNHKFDEVYRGPFRVINIKDSYIEVMRDNKRVKIHKNMVKKALAKYDEEPPLATPIIEVDQTED